MPDSTQDPEAGGPVPAESGGPVPAESGGPANQGSAQKGGLAAVFSLLGRAWLRYRRWRRSRPFWAGIWLILAGAELLLIPLPIRNMGIILHIGIGGISGILIGAVLILAGLLLWYHPAQHVFYSIVAVLLAIGALVASNLGGFLIGTVLGILGGSLGFAWMPGRPERRRRRRLNRPTEPDADPTLFTNGETGTEAAGNADADVRNVADDDARVQAGADTQRQALSTRSETASGPSAVAPVAGHEHGTVLRAFTLLPAVALLTGLLSATGLGGILDPGSAASSSPTACGSTPTASAAPSPAPTDSCSPSPAASTDPTPDPTSAPSPSASVGPAASPSASASPSPTASASPTPSTGTPPPFAIAASQSTLTAAAAGLSGFAYDGLVSVPTATGHVQMMEFSASSIDLSGVQLAVTQGGGTLTTTASSLDLNGDVALYATELSGDLVLAGVPVPISLTPDSPVSVFLQFLGDIGASQALTLQMTNVTTQQPYTSANGMATSDLHIS